MKTKIILTEEALEKLRQLSIPENRGLRIDAECSGG